MHGNKIGKITTHGIITEFTTSSHPSDITAGSDGNLWFTEPSANKIGRITIDGTITEFQVTSFGPQTLTITAGPDGNIWFTEYGANKIGRISLQKSTVSIPALNIWGIMAFTVIAGFMAVISLKRKHNTNI